MPIENRNQEQRRGSPPPSMPSATSLALRSFGTLFDAQLATMGLIVQSQARAAAFFGLPDVSDIISSTYEGAQRVVVTSTEQFLRTTERTNEALTEVQRISGHAVESQTRALFDQWTGRIDELSDRTDEKLTQIFNLAREQAAQVDRAAEWQRSEQQRLAEERAQSNDFEGDEGQEDGGDSRSGSRHTDELTERRSKRLRNERSTDANAHPQQEQDEHRKAKHAESKAGNGKSTRSKSAA
jgi:hypothetical protein